MITSGVGLLLSYPLGTLKLYGRIARIDPLSPSLPPASLPVWLPEHEAAAILAAKQAAASRPAAAFPPVCRAHDGDGRIDIFKTNFSDDTSTLYHNNGDGTYSDVTFPAGLGINTDALGWGAMFADVDNDGFPDLLLVNGHVYPEVDSAHLGAAFRERRDPVFTRS